VWLAHAAAIQHRVVRKTILVTDEAGEVLSIVSSMTAPVDPSDLDLGWNLGVLFRAYLERANAVFDDVPGGPRGYQVLVSAEREATGSQLALARRLGLDRTVMTYLIDDLVAAGLVERQVDPVDRRARVIKATAKGRRLLPRLDRRLAAVEDELLVALRPVQCAQLRKLLRSAAAGIGGGPDALDPRAIVAELTRSR
jgi:DNA-binding MarR family transcriptional regulator